MAFLFFKYNTVSPKYNILLEPLRPEGVENYEDTHARKQAVISMSYQEWKV